MWIGLQAFADQHFRMCRANPLCLFLCFIMIWPSSLLQTLPSLVSYLWHSCTVFAHMLTDPCFHRPALEYVRCQRTPVHVDWNPRLLQKLFLLAARCHVCISCGASGVFAVASVAC